MILYKTGHDRQEIGDSMMAVAIVIPFKQENGWTNHKKCNNALR